MSIFMIGLAGGIGSILRYLIGQSVRLNFPLGTLLVNLGGSLLMGLVMGLFLKQEIFGLHTKNILVAGFLGGFTTFSAFSFDTIQLIQKGDIQWAVLNVLLNVVGCLLLTFVGFRVVS